MTQASADRAPVLRNDEEISLLAWGVVLLRWRRTIMALGIAGAAVGVASGLFTRRMYVSTATFLPQVSEQSTSGLALAASQFGLRLPTGGSSWGPPVYVELLLSRALLEPIALDSFVVAEEGGRRAALMDLLKVKAPRSDLRIERALLALRKRVTAVEVKKLAAVKLSVTTRWPSVSLALAQRLVRGINQFNVESRKSQATAEREFVEVQAVQAEQALREAEDRLQSFLQRNRSTGGSPELEFERQRMQREVVLRQQVYTTLVQNREDARIREVRDTPVITVLEDPRLPVVGEARRSVQKGILGGIAGAAVGVLIALLARAVAAARRSPSEESREFFKLVSEVTPRFIKRGIG